MIELDGDFGEGGGSILRQALALSIFTGKDFIIKKIRQNRAESGLKPQHLASLEFAAKICNASYWGNQIGSSEVYFKPGVLKGSKFNVDIGTAGSATLLLQSVILPFVFSKKKIIISVVGGTNVSWSPSFEYFSNVFIPQVRRYAELECFLTKRGYFPKGSGELRVEIKGKYSEEDYLNPILLVARHNLLQIKGVSHASVDLEAARVAERQAEHAKLKLSSLGVPVNIAIQYSNSESTGSGLTLWAIFGNDEIDFDNPVMLGASSLGAKGKTSENVGLEAANLLLEEINSEACVDEHLADQLIPYLAVAGGILKTREITKHVLSNIYVCEKFLDVKFEIKGNTISCNKMSGDGFE